MQSIRLEKQEQAEPLDEATHAALDEAEIHFRKGESVTLEQSKTNARERYKAWQKTHQSVTLPV